MRLEAAERALAEGDRELDHDFMEPKHCERALKNLVLAKEFSGEATVHRLSMTLPLKRSDRSEKFHGALKDTWRRFRWKCEVVPKQEYSRRRNRK